MLLRYIILYEGDIVNRFWIIHASENRSSLKGIVKSGFEYVGKLYAKANCTLSSETSATAEGYHDLLDEMELNPSTQ